MLPPMAMDCLASGHSKRWHMKPACVAGISSHQPWVRDNLKAAFWTKPSNTEAQAHILQRQPPSDLMRSRPDE